MRRTPPGRRPKQRPERRYPRGAAALARILDLNRRGRDRLPGRRVRRGEPAVTDRPCGVGHQKARRRSPERLDACLAGRRPGQGLPSKRGSNKTNSEWRCSCRDSRLHRRCWITGISSRFTKKRWRPCSQRTDGNSPHLRGRPRSLGRRRPHRYGPVRWLSLCVYRERWRAAEDDLHRLFRTHGAAVRRWARRFARIPSDADDIAQEVFLVVHRRTDVLRHLGSPGRWLLRTTVNVAQHFRRTQIGRRRETSRGSSRRAVAARRIRSLSWKRREIAHGISEVLDTLDERSAEIYRLSELERMSTTAISALMGISPDDGTGAAISNATRDRAPSRCLLSSRRIVQSGRV